MRHLEQGHAIINSFTETKTTGYFEALRNTFIVCAKTCKILNISHLNGHCSKDQYAVSNLSAINWPQYA